MLVEKHPGSSPHPRAVGYTPRTLELLRVVGVAERIHSRYLGHGRPRRLRVDSLAGRWHEIVRWSESSEQGRDRVGRHGRDIAGDADRGVDSAAGHFEVTPCGSALMPQDRMEALLRAQAITLGADVRLGTRLLTFEQDAEGVTATIAGPDGEPRRWRADYMIAADGDASPIRESLAIPRSGHGFMQRRHSVIFRADLDVYLKFGIRQFQIDQPDFDAMLAPLYDGRWLLVFAGDEAAVPDEAALRGSVRRAIGREDVPFEIESRDRWTLHAAIAERFRDGRIFLVGDAAHTLPPARGGYGANTGIEDAFNLAWKLAAVISGASAPGLLDTYDAERRPVAWLRHAQIFARRDYARWSTEEERRVAVIDDDAMEFGQLYRSRAVLGADTNLPTARRPEQWAGQPGTRAPHLRASNATAQVSTVDLLHRDWTLVTSDAQWCVAAEQVRAQSGLALACLRFGETVSPPTSGEGPQDPWLFLEHFHAAFGIGSDGASLVRPDGYIAWRSAGRPDDPQRALLEALGRVACL